MIFVCLILSCIIFCGGGLVWSREGGVNLLVKFLLFGMGIFCLICLLKG